MKQKALALTGIFVALFFLLSPAVEASLIPGHLYLAQQVIPKLPPWLKDAVEKNQNAYYLGALGHDIADWASYYQRLGFGSDAGALLHEVKTGPLIIRMLKVYRRDYEDYSFPVFESISKKYLAFWMGWVTHWVTDAYIHTLVDKYGGNYHNEKSRHIQLELVESKHVCHKMNILDISFEDDDELYIFLSAACAEVFPEEKAYQPNPRSTAYAEPEPPLFVTMLKQGLNDYMLSGWECIRESCRTGTDKCGFWAKTAWNWKNAAIASNTVFNDVMHPLLFEDFYMSDTFPSDTFTVEVKVNDTGLYGKFLKEWDEVIPTAITKAADIFNQFYQYMKDPKTRLRDFLKNFPSIDILVPEGTVTLLDAKALDRYSADQTLRGLPAQEIRSLYCEYEFKKGGQSLKKGNLTAPIQFDVKTVVARGGIVARIETEKLYHSKQGTAKLVFPVTSLENNFSLQLKVSLSGPEPFSNPLVGGKPLFEGVEFIQDEIPALFVQRDYWDPEQTKIKREYTYYMRSDGKERIRHGKETRWYENGTTKEYVAFRRHNQFHGTMTRYWATGSVFDVTTYNNGAKEGTYTSYWDNKQLRSQGEFRKNRKNGHWSFFLRNGELEAQGSYYRKFSTIVYGCRDAISRDPDRIEEGLSWECGNKFGNWKLPDGQEKVFAERGDLDDEVERAIWARPQSGLEKSLDDQINALYGEIEKLEQRITELSGKENTGAERSRLGVQIFELKKKQEKLQDDRRQEREALNRPIRESILAKEDKLPDL